MTGLKVRASRLKRFDPVKSKALHPKPTLLPTLLENGTLGDLWQSAQELEMSAEASSAQRSLA